VAAVAQAGGGGGVRIEVCRPERARCGEEGRWAGARLRTMELARMSRWRGPGLERRVGDWWRRRLGARTSSWTARLRSEDGGARARAALGDDGGAGIARQCRSIKKMTKCGRRGEERPHLYSPGTFSPVDAKIHRSDLCAPHARA